MAKVLLIDGCGNAVVCERTLDVLTILIGTKHFEKMKEIEIVEGHPLEVYRLQGAGKPKIRHVNRYLIREP